MKYIRARSALGDTKEGANLGMAVPLRVKQHHRQSLSLRQLIQRRIQSLPQEGSIGDQVWRGTRRGECCWYGVGMPHPTPTAQISRGIQRNPGEPGCQGGAGIETRQPGPGGKEGILGRVIRVFRMTQHGAREPPNHRAVALDQGAKRRLVTGLGLEHQLSVSHWVYAGPGRFVEA